MPYTHIRAEDLEPAFRRNSSGEEGSLWIKEITNLFPWCMNHRLYWAATREHRNAVAVVSSSGKIQCSRRLMAGGFYLVC